MKTNVFRILLFFVLIILSASCNKEPEINLVGTAWGCEYDGGGSSMGYHIIETYEFLSATDGRLIIESRVNVLGTEVKDTETLKFSYVLDYPHITMFYEEIKTQHFTFTDKKTMVRDGTSGSDSGSKYTKQ